jgi:hypothetical protein
MSKSGDWYIRENPEDDDSGYDEWLMEQGYQDWLKNNEKVKDMNFAEKTKEERKKIVEARIEACRYVESVWKNICKENPTSDDKHHIVSLHDAIWHASINILPAFEVQAVIDTNDRIFVSTGTSGYVDYLTIDPSTLIGMKLPIKCWIHTHPFGAAYFSGTDWRTVNIWGDNMECAYVLGSEMSSKGHYGFWDKYDKNQLEIYVNGEHTQTQKQIGSEEE